MGKWKALTRVLTYPLVHPGTTAKTALTTAKGTLMVGGASYIGWDMLAHDKSLVRSVSDTVIGEENVDAVVEKVESIGDMASAATDKLSDATEALTGATSSVAQMGQSMNGIQNFFTNLTNGNAGNMFSNFFRNLTSGNVSGLGLAGLIGGALLAFGRFGWFGKIAGALLMMFTIGANAHREEQTQQVGQRTNYSSASVYPSNTEPDRLFIKAWDKDGNERPALSVDRNEYQKLKEAGYTPVSIYALLAVRQELNPQVEQTQTGSQSRIH